MALSQIAYGGNTLGRANAAADTAFYAVVPGLADNFTAVASFAMTSGNTANDGVWMRPIGRANVATAVTSGADVVLDADPSASGNTIAAGDQCVLKHTDGTYRRYQVNTAGWNSTTKTVTFTANVAANVATGANFWNFGINTDTDPVHAAAHPRFASVANTQRVYTFQGAGVRGNAKGDPLLFYCPNATNATVLDYAEYVRSIE